jgi:hypothetical protein
MSVLEVALDPATVIVAVDPGKVLNRVWVSNGAGLLTEPVSLPVSREGVHVLEDLLTERGAAEPVIAVEATGDLHRPWVIELERRHPGSVRIFAPSETRAARTQLGSARFKTDDRDCAALTYLARQGRGRLYDQESAVDALRAAVRHRRGLVIDRKVAQQRLHAQLNALCPGLSAPAGHGRALPVASPTGLAVLGCAAAFAGRPPRLRSLLARTPGRMSQATAEYWVHRWRGCLAPPADAEQRARRLDRDLHRYRALQADITSLDAELTELLAATEGQILTTLPGSRSHPRCRVRGVQPAHYALSRRGTPVLGNRLSTRPLPVGNPASPWPNIPTGPRRAPRRVDGHGLGSVDQLAVLRRTQRRTARPRDGTDPGSGGLGPQCLPPRLSAAANPTTLR